MKDSLINSLLSVCRLLEKYDIQYILIGGVAVALNGYYRHSLNFAGELAEKPDIDIWYNPTYENYFNILKIIKELGQDIAEFEKEKTPNPRESFFRLNFEDFTFDVLPKIKADIKFADAYRRKDTIMIEGSKIYFMNFVDLIKDKEASSRKKDLEDIVQLKKLREE